MLFNSYEFIFLFLPLAVAGFAIIGARAGVRAALGWLTLASVGFYAWWNPIYVLLLFASLGANYALGSTLAAQAADKGKGSRLLLGAGIAGNLAVLAYFKYAGFLIANFDALTGANYAVVNIILPLGVSFITFQKIAFLVDSWSGDVKRVDFLHFALFVTFFPQLIAGPIVHHAEIIPQFEGRKDARIRSSDVAIGVTIFCIGLFKKAILADGLSAYANPVFAAAATGERLDFFQAWGGALAYTFQLYFDFSGYSDMAVGGARIFGIVLPMNFNSPYKATNIVDFWRRWHMSLSRFLRDYVYFPLGGNRNGEVRRFVNLFATMVIGGLWHGAAWTFVVWGALHGAYLIVNHAWRAARARLAPAFSMGWAGRRLAQAVTFAAVVVGWVYFRAESFSGAGVVLTGMAGFNGIAVPEPVLAALGGAGEALVRVGIASSDASGRTFALTWMSILVGAAIAFLAPNTYEFMRTADPVLNLPKADNVASGPGWLAARLGQIQWSMRPLWAGFAAVLGVAGVLALPEVTEFLYFQF
jgi:D-alanyl-lipoteichoic acid acyltransferase DltB (MBOAT superfamily)